MQKNVGLPGQEVSITMVVPNIENAQSVNECRFTRSTRNVYHDCHTHCFTFCVFNIFLEYYDHLERHTKCK